MAQQQRPFVADPNEWEVVGDDDLEVVEDAPAPKAATWSDKLGLNQPVPSMPSAGRLEPAAATSLGFLRGVGSGAVDMAQGAASSLMGIANSFASVEDQGAVNTAQAAGKPYQPEARPPMPSPDNLSGKVGAMLPDVAMSVMPIGEGVAAAKNALPSAARAGKNFQTVMGAAKDIVVDVGPAGDRALRVYDLAQKGAYLPKPVANFLQWVTNPKKAALTYKDSRDFASAMSRLSAAERSSMTPTVKREVAQMAADLNLANANAAKAAGRGAEYKAAMREYANAMAMRDAIDGALKHSKKAALGAAGLGGAYYLFKD